MNTKSAFHFRQSRKHSGFWNPEFSIQHSGRSVTSTIPCTEDVWKNGVGLAKLSSQMAALSILLFFMWGGWDASAAAAYDVIKLPGLSTSTTYGWGINEAGEVTGWSATTNGPAHAIVYSNGVTRDLGSLGGNGSGSYGFAINNRGQVAGKYDIAFGSPAEHAFLYGDGIMTDLGTLGGQNSFPNGMNDLGDVVGVSDGSNGLAGFIYTGGHMTQFDLVTLNGINNQGQIVGFDGTNAVLYDHGTLTDLGSLGGLGSYGYHINERGDVVGGSQTGTGMGGAFLYADGRLISLGTIGPELPLSLAFGVNNQRSVVGEIYNNSTGVYHAFVYQDGQMRDLNTLVDLEPGLVLTDAQGINDAGQIVANGNYGGPYNYGFLLTPSCQPPVIETITTTPAVLWPPNHKMQAVTVTVVATATCHIARSRIVSISSNDSTALQTGKTGAGDYEITGDLTANLRAEKSPAGGVRVYTLTIECTDDAGNASTGLVTATVP